MTPAIDVVTRDRVKHTVHSYEHDADVDSYGLEASRKLGVEPHRVFKTLVVSLDGEELAVAVLPVDQQLSMKRLARALGAKKAAMAEPAAVQRSTGYVLGGVSPLGQKKRLRTVIDCSAEALLTLFVSAGRRGLEIELSPGDLSQQLGAKFAAIQHAAG